MRHARGQLRPAAQGATEPAVVVGRHARRLSVAALQVLAAVRFDDAQVQMLVSGMHHEVSALVTAVEGMSDADPDELQSAAQAVLRLGLLATRATLVAVADGSWGGQCFDAAEQACADLVGSQEEFAYQFVAGPRATTR